MSELIQSMTGFGQASLAFKEYQLQVELKSVNHRYLEMTIRLPRQWSRLEDAVKQRVRSSLQRGKLDAFVSIVRQTAENHVVTLDWSLAEAYYNAAQQLRTKFGLPDTLTIQDLLQIPELIKLGEPSNDVDPLLQDQMLSCLDEALVELNLMRQTEGKHLQTDLATRLAALRALHQSMQLLAPKVIEQYRQKLRIRLQDALEGIPYDEQRLLQEVALHIDRTNVDEELTRLESHFQQFSQLLQAIEPVGRKLDFLLQEMNREVNTIGSKANDSDLINDVVEMKAELEKMREQVQNIQ
ncbi:YicC/YloC family endoribonuclease [Paenibacillus psychroresistens]|uniref:YicC/YloC family endoribonuclease n=1 Tax=Paenibacillus psychroresistens TaxID=1778678 RepID=UPI001D052C81|nr:YicC/YloC family endoribonuclease [Paenibacillus psychroresistens]